jgi:uncharacterized protein YbjT (DUF2867 family)
MSAAAPRPRLLLVGGGGGLVGRATLAELGSGWAVRSVHRHRVPREEEAGVEWVPADISAIRDWRTLLEGVDVVLNLAWYRSGPESRFRRLYEGLHRMLEAAGHASVRRVLQVSVPPAPEHLESTLPYLQYKRRFDHEVVASGLSYRIVRPTMLFGPRDVLLTVMLREIDRYPFFPMFGDGRFHVSPVAVADLARLLRREADGTDSGTTDVGGPARYEYRELTDLLFRAVGKRPRYWRLSPSGSLRFASVLQAIGSSRLYRYEVEWLMSDRLGLPPYSGLDRPLTTVESFLHDEVGRRRRRPSDG